MKKSKKENVLTAFLNLLATQTHYTISLILRNPSPNLSRVATVTQTSVKFEIFTHTIHMQITSPLKFTLEEAMMALKGTRIPLLFL